MINKKILLFDIETAPNLSFVWGQWEQNVIRHKKEGYMLSFAYKWLGEDKVHAYSLKDFKNYKKDMQNDKELVTKLWELFNEADIIIAHNGDRFDIKKSNTYFAKAGLTPPSPYKTVDTRKEAKKYFYFNSNKLDDLGDYLGVGRKAQTGGFTLWEKCMAGDMDAWRKMIKYNKQDVVLLEDIYIKLLPWMKTHPEVTVEPRSCTKCGSERVQKRGFSVGRKSTKQRCQCQDCGAWDHLLEIKATV